MREERSLFRAPTKCLYGCDHKKDLLLHLFVTNYQFTFHFNEDYVLKKFHVKLTNPFYELSWKIADHV